MFKFKNKNAIKTKQFIKNLLPKNKEKKREAQNYRFKE
jgi:hypothetical protein